MTKTSTYTALVLGLLVALPGCNKMMRHSDGRVVSEPPNPAYTRPHDPAYNNERMRCSPGRHKEHRC